MTSKLKNLLDEQRVLQIEGQTCRFNTLDEYSMNLGFSSIDSVENIMAMSDILDLDKPSLEEIEFYKDQQKKNKIWREKGIKQLIINYLKKKDSVMWVDLGCGNAVALRQAKIYLEEQGIDSNRLLTYGYDVLDMDYMGLLEHMRDSTEYQPQLFHGKYEPYFGVEDISAIKFEQRPDIITAHDVLFWTHDPLKLFINAYEQLNVGGTMACNRTSRIHYSYDEPGSKIFYGYLFQRMFNGPWRNQTQRLQVTAETFIVEKTADDNLKPDIKGMHRSENIKQAFNYLYYI